MKKNPRLGSTLDDLLRQDGAVEEIEARAQKRVLARQLDSSCGNRSRSPRNHLR